MKKLLCISMLFILISCGKKQEIRISALNPANGQPWAGLHYTITKQKTGAFEEKYKKVGEGYLDENGIAVHTLRLGNASYEINIESPGNICYINNTSYTFEKNSSNFVFVFEMARCGNYQLSINNINCQSINDTIIINQTNLVGSFLGVDWIIKGCNGYSTVTQPIPEGNVYTKYEVIRLGISQIFYDTLFIVANQNNNQVINY